MRTAFSLQSELTVHAYVQAWIENVNTMFRTAKLLVQTLNSEHALEVLLVRLQ